jgi:hypothetical protein
MAHQVLGEALTIKKLGEQAVWSMPKAKTNPYNRSNRIKEQLKSVGVTKYGMKMAGVRYLSKLIRPDEQIMGVIYGRNEDGSVVLVATDRRVIYIDKKPFFSNFDELTYDIVSGVSYGQSWVFTTVKLHTRVKDYELHWVNPKCARYFIRFIESNRLEKDFMTHLNSYMSNIRGI